MRTKNGFIKAALMAVIIAGMAFMTSCTQRGRDDRTAYNNTREKDPKEVAEDINQVMLDTRKEEKDAQFLVDAAEINLKEIELGELAQKKSTDAEVKRIGEAMVTDHKRQLSELKALAARKGIQLPTGLTEDVKDVYIKMSKKTESEFNEDYCDRMVREHKKAINKFENAAKNAQDYDIQIWASSSLPNMRTHLTHADICQNKNKADKTSMDERRVTGASMK